MTRLEAYQSSVEQSKIWVPIQFNWSEMRNEHREIEQILRKYCSWQPFTSDNVNEAMLAEIREAGGDRVKRELQRQLDEWLEENVEWLELCNATKNGD
jgi:hypothetical protein